MEDGEGELSDNDRVQAKADGAVNAERLQKAKQKVRTLAKNAKDRTVLPSREEV